MTNGMNLDSSVLGLHSVTVLKNNMEHFEKMKIRTVGFFKAALEFIYHNGRQIMITFK